MIPPEQLTSCSGSYDLRLSTEPFKEGTAVKTFIYLARSFSSMKCEVCKKTVEETFLKKILGTYVYTKEGKKKTKHLVCPACQKSVSLEDLKKKLA